MPNDEEYYLVYSNTDEPRIQNKYLKDGFQHVMILYWYSIHWLRLEPSWSGISFDSVFSVPDDELISVYQSYGYTVQKVNKEHHTKLRVPSILAPFTCVEVVKAVLGIRKFNIFTPYQLYRYVEDTQGGPYGHRI